MTPNESLEPTLSSGVKAQKIEQLNDRFRKTSRSAMCLKPSLKTSPSIRMCWPSATPSTYDKYAVSPRRI